MVVLSRERSVTALTIAKQVRDPVYVEVLEARQSL